MNTAESRTIPGEIRFLLTLAGWLLPQSLRREWKREWLAEFSQVFTATSAHSSERGQRWRMFKRAVGAVFDTWTLLQLYGIQGRLAEAAHSRVTPVVLPALVLLTIAWGTNGFQQTRDLLFRMDSDNLVLLVQPIPFMGGSSRVPVPGTGSTGGRRSRESQYECCRPTRESVGRSSTAEVAKK